MRAGQAALLAAALVALVYGGAWAVDYRHAGGVGLRVVVTPPRLPADGHARASFVVVVTDPGGTPRAGDTIEVLDEGPGAFDRTRALTDRRGRAAFVYTAAQSSVYQPAGPVPVLVTDSSLGRMVEIDKDRTVTIQTVDPAKQKGA